MKNLKIFLFLICGIFTSSCVRPTTDAAQDKVKHFKVIEYDGCEYITYEVIVAHYTRYALTHKGNCKNPIHCYEIK